MVWYLSWEKISKAGKRKIMKFDVYEYIGVIIPGSVIVLTANRLFPVIGTEVSNSLSLGDLGVMLILFFIAGHIVQAFGNAFEDGFWKCLGGMPTTWPANPKKKLLSSDQNERLAGILKDSLGSDLSSLKNGRGPIREIFSIVRKNGSVERIEKFNRTYGLCRGVSISFFLSALLVLYSNPIEWQLPVLLVFFGGIMAYRMYRFGQHYGREIFVELLACQDSTESQSTST